VSLEEARAAAWAATAGGAAVASLLAAAEAGEVADEGEEDDDSSTMDCSGEAVEGAVTAAAAVPAAATPSAVVRGVAAAGSRRRAVPASLSARRPGPGASSTGRPERRGGRGGHQRRTTLAAMTPSMLGKMFGAAAEEAEEEEAEEEEEEEEGAGAGVGAGQDTADVGAMAALLDDSVDTGGLPTAACGAATADLSALIGALGRPGDDAPARAAGPGRGGAGPSLASLGGAATARAISEHSAADEAGEEASSFHDTTRGSSTGAFSDEEGEGGSEDDEALARMAAQASVLADSAGDLVGRGGGRGRRAGMATPGARGGATASGRGALLAGLTPASEPRGLARTAVMTPTAAPGVDDDVTINTRLAVADLDAMLASPSAHLGPGRPQAQPAAAPGFAVFEDDEDDAPPRTAASAAPQPAASCAFEIFDDAEAEGPPAPSAAPSGFVVFEDDAASPAAPAAAPAPFAVFDDEADAGSPRPGPPRRQGLVRRRDALGSVPASASPHLSPIACPASARPGTSLATPALHDQRHPADMLAFARGDGASPRGQVSPAARQSRGSRRLGALPEPPSFGIFQDSPPAPAAALASFVDENWPAAGLEPVRPPARSTAHAFRELSPGAEPEHRAPSAGELLAAARNGGSVDVGSAFLVFDDGLDEAGARRAAAAAGRR